MKVAASKSRANAADRRTDREKDLTKGIDYALFEIMVRRMKHNMPVLEAE
jgi:hypothetical protein